MVDAIKDLPYVTVAEEYLSMCTEAGAALIAEKIKEFNLNRIVVAACTPQTHLRVFRKVIRENGLDQSMLEFANIREHDSYVHRDNPEIATKKAIEILRAAIARAALLEIIPIKKVDIKPTTLIVGGGIAGMSAALSLADQGYKVSMVEKSTTIGGHSAMFDRIFPTDECCI